MSGLERRERAARLTQRAIFADSCLTAFGFGNGKSKSEKALNALDDPDI
jgi:hypothetical protein